MARMRVTQQTTSFPVAGRPGARTAPRPQAAPWSSFHGLLQRLLEEPGWNVLRPTVDFVLLCGAVVLALDGAQVTAVRAPLLAMPPLVMLVFFLRGLYRTRLRALVLDGLVPVLSAVSVAAMVVAMIGLFANGQMPTQSDWVRGWLFALVFVGFGRIALANAQRWARSAGLIGKPVLIMGVGFVDDDPRTVAEVGGRDVPVLGTLEELDRIVERSRIEHLIVAFSSVADARVSRLIRHCQELGIEVSVVPRMFDTMNHRAGYETVGGLPLLSFEMVDPKGWQFAIKYTLDRAIAGLVLLLLSPLLALLAIAVKLSTGGPILFRQPRVGLDGREFDMLKFRTMRGSPDQQGESDAEWAEEVLGENGAAPALAASAATALATPPDASASAAATLAPSALAVDRRTAVGRVLRRLSLDELPQFWNVVNGDMSLIGPRPERASYVRRFEPVVYRYGDRHRVKSGITGWAQVHGLRGKTSLSERVEWDNYYIAHWSLGLDMKIVLLTVIALFRNAE
jgi:exopolysaccharide biosynthesis polyprenyl glycosylphosphotransferase